MILSGLSADPGATNPARAIVSVPTRSPRRQWVFHAPQAITRRLAPPAPVTAPLGIPLLTQDASWRAQATRIAWETDGACAATYLGPSARGATCYRVQTAATPAHTVRVSFIANQDAQTVDDGRWLCECATARRGLPCRHVGAAYLLANQRAVVAESIALAQAERMGWAWATSYGKGGDDPDAATAFYRVARAQGRCWDYAKVVWDTRNRVALWCDCGASHGCAHIGAVALRIESDRREYLTRCQQTWH